MENSPSAYRPPNLKGRVALVAGATRGLGRGIALALGESGATVYCTGRSTAANRIPRKHETKKSRRSITPAAPKPSKKPPPSSPPAAERASPPSSTTPTPLKSKSSSTASAPNMESFTSSSTTSPNLCIPTSESSSGSSTSKTV